MSNILELVLQKLGKKSPAELSQIGRETYERFEKILTGEPLTLDKLHAFMKSERASIQDDLDKGVEMNSNLDMFLKARSMDCKIWITLMESPKQAAEMLEQYLKKIHGIK